MHLFEIPGIAEASDVPLEVYRRLRPIGARFVWERGPVALVGVGGAARADAFTGCDALRDIRKRAPRLGGLGGLYGVGGFALVRAFERVPTRSRPGEPDLALVAPNAILRCEGGRVRLFTDDGALAREIRIALRHPAPSIPGLVGPARAGTTDGDFLDAVRAAQDHIRMGDVFQLVLSIRFAAASDADPVDAFAALRRLNPSPYQFLFDTGSGVVVGCSPEALARLDGGQAELVPIAGTRPRGRDAAEDRRRENELRTDPKEAAEHVMLVDLARNDLGRVAVPGSVRVEPFRTVERYSHVLHLVSGVRGRLAPDKDAFDLFQAAFPAGTVSGAPKVRAIELIDAFEPEPRGFYAGTAGRFGVDGSMDQALVLRSLFFADGTVSWQAGAGIVHRSVPKNELLEIRSKAAAMAAALQVVSRRAA